MSHTNGITGSNPLIGSSVGQSEKTSAADRTKSTAKAAVKELSTSEGAGTTTSLSGTGSLLAAALVNGDDVRTEKVEALKAAIANGTYNVSADKVADKLIDNMLR